MTVLYKLVTSQPSAHFPPCCSRPVRQHCFPPILRSSRRCPRRWGRMKIDCGDWGAGPGFLENEILIWYFENYKERLCFSCYLNFFLFKVFWYIFYFLYFHLLSLSISSSLYFSLSVCLSLLKNGGFLTVLPPKPAINGCKMINFGSNYNKLSKTVFKIFLLQKSQEIWIF